MNVQCLRCKGRGFCGRIVCPHIVKSEAVFKVRDKLTKKDFSGAAPSPFVGRIGYPKLNVGILTPVDVKEDAWVYDAPRHWAEHNFKIPEIVDYRTALINSRFVVHAHDVSKVLDTVKEVGMASKPVELEINLKNKPRFRINSDSFMAPTGPNAKLKKAKVTSNPKISFKVEKVVDDSELKANDAMLYLYKSGFDENFLSKLLSVGTIGLKPNRKLVPTRWSISAVDDNIGKDIIKEIRDFKESDYLSFFGSYLGNYYLVLMFPEPWSYELFEIYAPKASWNTSTKVQFTTDYEGYGGRKSYAENCAGGYYAARLPILEKLKGMKRQSTILALRFITGEYIAPLGVWVCREATRKSMESKPLTFASKELMLDYAKKLVKKKFGIDLDQIFDKSILVNKLKTQSKLTGFF